MSRQGILWHEVVDSYPCPTCGAAPGERCRTMMGHPKWEPHSDRSRLASAGHWQYAEGQTWICDRCMGVVTRSQIADMADGEHVLCIPCVEGREGG